MRRFHEPLYDIFKDQDALYAEICPLFKVFSLQSVSTVCLDYEAKLSQQQSLLSSPNSIFRRDIRFTSFMKISCNFTLSSECSRIETSHKVDALYYHVDAKLAFYDINSFSNDSSPNFCACQCDIKGPEPCPSEHTQMFGWLIGMKETILLVS